MLFSALCGARTGVVNLKTKKDYCVVFTGKYLCSFPLLVGNWDSRGFCRKMANDDTVDLF